jgi:hypothetical protein
MTRLKSMAMMAGLLAMEQTEYDYTPVLAKGFFNPIHKKNKPNRKNMNLVSKRTKSKHKRK